MISLCMIIKDEEKLLDRFLKKVTKYVDEIIIVDTGSKDSSKIIAKAHTPFVYDFKWNDDFSKARNFSISKATKEWILWLDPDEYVVGLDKIKDLVKNNRYLGYRFVQETFINGRKYVQGICKLFQNNKGIKFVYPIHESVMPSIRDKKGAIGKTRIIVKNKGNYNLEKAEYYLKLLEKKGKKYPKSSWKKEKELMEKVSESFLNPS